MTITLEMAIRTTKEVIAERGEDFVYNPKRGACAYVPRSHPDFAFIDFGGARVATGADVTGCLVGEIFTKLGVMTSEIARSGLITEAIFDRGIVLATGEAQEFLSSLQAYQDVSYSWGEAYKQTFKDLYGEDCSNDI